LVAPFRTLRVRNNTITFVTDITGVATLGAPSCRHPVLSSGARNSTSGSTHPFFSARLPTVTNLAGVMQVLARGNTHLHSPASEINNTDLACSRLHNSEKVTTQLRFEAYNCSTTRIQP